MAAVCAAALLGGAVSTAVWEAGDAEAESGSVLSRNTTDPSVRLTDNGTATSPSRSATRANSTDASTPTAVRTRDAAPPTVVPEQRRAPSVLTLPGQEVLPVEPVGVERSGPLAGHMVVPDDPRIAGWYRHGTAPLDQGGAVVIAAHADRAGLGAGPLARLERIRAGENIVLRVGRQDVRYRVERVEVLIKDRLDAAALFDTHGPARLHLVSCGGRFDRAQRRYAANVVVTATRLT